MSSTTVSVRIDAVIKKRLEKLAKSTGRSRSFLAAEAINEYLELNEWQVPGFRRLWLRLIAVREFRMSVSGNGLTPGTVKRSDRLPGARRNEHPVVA